jgi:hypothetical protein
MTSTDYMFRLILTHPQAKYSLTQTEIVYRVYNWPEGDLE